MNKRVLGILAVSRSFGDHSCKRFVTARPHISRTELSDDAEFVVIACDGVFDVLLDEDVTQLVKAEAKEGRMKSCAERIIQEALDRGSTDNVTALVIALKPVEQWSWHVC